MDRNMSQRRSVIVSSLLCAAALAAAMSVFLFWSSRKYGVDSIPAETCTQLEVSVGFPGGTQKLHIWQGDGGVFYFFLPTGSDHWEVRFCNLGEGSSVRLDAEIFTASNAVIEHLEYSKTYELEFYSGQEGTDPESGQIVFLESAEIPALFIETASGSMERIHADKEVKEPASVALIGIDGNNEYCGQLEYIKARGSSSFYEMEKKSYQIKLEKGYGLLDMPLAEKWILLADMLDDSLIKNDIIFRFAENYTEVPSIQGRFVDLYLNGDYVGNYYLCEKIEISDKRLNITNLEEATEKINGQDTYDTAALYVSEDGKIKATSGLVNPKDITGGYLVRHIPAHIYEDETNAFMTEGGNCYQIVSPNPATVEQAQYICGQFNELELAFHQEDGIHPGTGRHFSEYLDVDSWIQKYLMEEMFHNPDVVSNSMYFYKDCDSIDTHIYSGPMWDYDRTMGSYGAKKFWLDDPRQLGNFGIYVQEMMQYQEVRDQVYDQFQQLYLPYAKYLAGADIYRTSAVVKESAEMDGIRWPGVYGYYSDFDTSRDALINFLKQKAEYLEDVWLDGEEYCTITFLDYQGNVYEKYNVKKGEYLENAPVITTYAAIFSGWRNVESNALFNSRLPILENAVYRSEWIEMDVLLQNGLAMSGQEASQVDSEIIRQFADRLEMMQEQAEAESTDTP